MADRGVHSLLVILLEKGKKDFLGWSVFVGRGDIVSVSKLETGNQVI